MPYAYSTQEDTGYVGGFETREEAVQAAREDGLDSVYYLGEERPPIQPENLFDPEDWLEKVSCQEDYSIEAADGWSDPVTKDQLEELQAEVSLVMAAWLDRHKLRPKFFLVENIEVVNLDEEKS